MADTLRPGNLNIVPTDFSEFANSMAEAMEEELDDLLALDGLPPLVKDATDRGVRDRRRFMIAIARGVVRHLVERHEAFDIRHDGDTIYPDIDAEQL
ncbi:hypothetical protein [Aliiroseovarius sp. YM-037]|uniref:hypothetical protein n=1 Tax=Aliiroseovarius sp. YM-037 TaxID=3341728 RepID=UPI003A7F911D